MDKENVFKRLVEPAGVYHPRLFVWENWSIYCIFCRETKWYHESRNNSCLVLKCSTCLFCVVNYDTCILYRVIWPWSTPEDTSVES